MALADTEFLLIFCLFTSSPSGGKRGEGLRGACAPGGTVQGAAFGGAKMQNSEIRPLVAN